MIPLTNLDDKALKDRIRIQSNRSSKDYQDLLREQARRELGIKPVESKPIQDDIKCEHNNTTIKITKSPKGRMWRYKKCVDCDKVWARETTEKAYNEYLKSVVAKNATVGMV